MIQQRDKWDCGVCCVAEALGLSWEQSRQLLGEPNHDGDKYTGYHLAEIHNALRKHGVPTEIRGYQYAGCLSGSILHVGNDAHRMPYHFVWVDPFGRLRCPAGVFKSWSAIVSIGMSLYIKVTQGKGTQ